MTKREGHIIICSNICIRWYKLLVLCVDAADGQMKPDFYYEQVLSGPAQ